MNEQLSEKLNTSRVRLNLLEWMDFQKDSDILLVGKTADVFMEFFSEKEVHISFFKDIREGLLEKFDDIIFIEDPMFPSEHQINETFVLEVSDYLKEGGRLILAVNNRFGFKFLIGGATGEDSNLYHDSNVGVVRKQLDRWLKKAEYVEISYFYPTPDHVFPTQIFSDQFLPESGDLRSNTPEYWENSVRSGNENQFAYKMCEEGLFPELANSYLIVAKR